MDLNHTKLNAHMIVGVFMGILNAIFWTFSLLRFGFVYSTNFIWWMLFCCVLNLGVSISVAQKNTWRFQRLFWAAGITLLITIIGAIIGGSIGASNGINDLAIASFISGVIQGGLIGLIVGCIAGLVTL